jgi:hypothetical protein
MQITIRRKLAIGSAVLAAAAFAGGAYAATQDSPASTRQAFLNDVAKRLNVAPQQLTAALQGAFLDQVDAAVAAGKLTKSQADAIKRHVQQSGSRALGGWQLLGRMGFQGPRRFGRPGLPGRHGIGALAAAAEYLGLSGNQLSGQLGSGKSLAALARSRGKSTVGLKDAMTAAVRAKLDKARTAKLITSVQERQLLSRLSAGLDQEINRTGARPGFGARGERRRFGPGAAARGWSPPSGLPGGAGGASPPPGSAGPAY